jgi:AcrR family transcriptional regulator
MANYIKRSYQSESRSASAGRTQAKVLEAGKFLFSRKGIDATTIAQIAGRAGVSQATVYGTVKSKSGLLQALMQETMFGPPFQQAQTQLESVTDPVERIAMTARVARAIYEAESAELSLLMKASAFSPELRKSLQGFETLRRDMQRERVDSLFKSGRARKGLDRETAVSLLWMFTGRDVYHKLVHESGWTPDKFEQWLARTLLEALTDVR